jgi:prolyl 4-hydroxylase
MSRLDHSFPYIKLIRDVLTPEECAALIVRIDDLEPQLATVNTIDGPRINTKHRNNERVIFDDQDLARLVVERSGENIPHTFLSWEFAGANERFRCYRYKQGMRFKPHGDGSFERHIFERSFYSFLVYLNEGFEGGETNFFVNPEISVKPETGMALMFQHPLLHEGAEVTNGMKYVARTDLMYRQWGIS